MLVLTSEQMKKVESNAVNLGLSWLRLMENAGSAAAKEIRNAKDLKDKRIVIVCGKGNNGGDGFVIARKLHENNISSRVITIDTPSTDSAKEMFAKMSKLGIKPVDFGSYEQLCSNILNDADIIIDCIFGTGFKGEPQGIFAKAISAINRSDAEKIAIDIPSGIESDSGETLGEFVKADTTITFAAYKPCHLLFPSNEYCGNVVVTSIGIPASALEGVTPYAAVVTNSDCKSLLPKRSLNHHKGLSGTLAVYAGNIGFSGATVFSLKAAVKSGVGIANAIIPERIYDIIGTSVPEAICTILKGDPTGNPNIDDTIKIINSINSSNAALVGCGIGTSKYSKFNLNEILSKCNVPLCLDADGINLCADNINLLREYPSEKVLTPHPKEAARLIGSTVDDIQKNRSKSALIIAKLTKSVTVLKGANTCIATPTGELFFITDGNPGMATAGTGDVLAGMIAAFLAEGLPARESAVLGTKLHSFAGDEALSDSSILSLTPTDMLNVLPRVIKSIY